MPSSNQPPVAEWANSFWYMIRIGALQANAGLDDNAAAHIVNFMASMAVVIPCPDCRADFAKDWVEEPFTMAHAKSAEMAMTWVEDLRRKVERHVAEQRLARGLGNPPPGARSLLPPSLVEGGGASLLEEATDGDDDEDEAGSGGAAAPAAAREAREASLAPEAPITRTGARAPPPEFLARSLLGPMPPKRRRALASVLRGGRGPVSTLTAQAHAASTMAEDGTHPPGRPNPAAAQLRTFALRSALQVTAANNSGRRMGCACPASKTGRR